MAITEDRGERALSFLAETDAEYADRRVMMLRTEYLAEVTENLTYKSLRDSDGSVEDCKREARSSEEYKTKFEEYLKAVREYEFLRARRKRAELTFEAWRSINANRRQGGST
jgi:hypothetical protein